MRYLIICPGHPPFFDHWFDPENNFVEGMMVIDLEKGIYTHDGYDWTEIEFNHL